MTKPTWYEIEDEQAELGGILGDPRRCPIHGETISSPNGMFDGVCGQCEYLSSMEDPDPNYVPAPTFTQCYKRHLHPSPIKPEEDGAAMFRMC